MVISPLWSVMIPTYNASQYLAETLASVLQQAPDASVMEIVVIDNCSTDNTEAIVAHVGKGRVEFRPNSSNVGMMQNFNECIRHAKGQLLHILHADDLVKLEFYSEFAQAFASHPDVALISCNASVIDEYGTESTVTEPINSLKEPSNAIKDLLIINPFRTPAVVVRRGAYNIVGGFDVTLTHTADWDMWVRIVCNYKGLHLNRTLCEYREHSDNGTSKASITGMNITDTEQLFAKFAKLGYPVNTEAQKDVLVNEVRNQFKKFYNSRNMTGMKNMLKLYSRMLNKISAVELFLRMIVNRL